MTWDRSSSPLMETEALLEPGELETLRSEIMAPTFRALEDAWSAIETVGGPVALVDMKIEVGYREADGRLVVADVIEFGEAVKLVRERGRLMQEAAIDRPGGMAAIIGLDEVTLEHICAETGVELANINSDDQMVVSGDKMAVARAMDLSSARGARLWAALLLKAP